MKNGMTQTEIKNKIYNIYLEIKSDIYNNLDTVFNKKITYTKKYRGNITTDINIGFIPLEGDYHGIQIFIREEDIWIKEIMVFDKKNKHITDILNIKING